MKRRLLVPVLALSLAAISTATAAQPAPERPAAAPLSTLDGAQRAEIVAKLSEALRRRYVFPDIGERAAVAIEAALGSGDYDGLTDPAAFAARLTADAYVIAHDKHLNISTVLAPPRSDAPMDLPRAQAGIVRADRLAGGIGYVEIVGFPPPLSFSPVLDRAMSGLAGSRALIIDVRRNGGGSPDSVAYLTSFLVPPDRPLNDIVARIENTRDFSRKSYRSVPTPVSFNDAPVYILTSARTFSGGEGFAYEVQAQKRGLIIGEVTGGGANPTGLIDLAQGFTASIPFGRAENPVTRTNWEGRGVQPDLLVPARDALAAALARAGGKAVSDVGPASLEQVFVPRTAPHPGSEAALRALVAGLASGTPDFSALTPDLAALIRTQRAAIQAQYAMLGALDAVTFRGPDMMDGDEYRLHFANGDLQLGILLAPDGKIAGLSAPLPAPPRP